MTKDQLEYFGKEASRTYIEEDVSLDDTITKIAEEHALNRFEIDRVVEAANVDTHLAMFGKMDDKYVEFPTASAEKVAAALSYDTELKQETYDYNSPPEVDNIEVNIFPVVEAEKTSSVGLEDPYSQESQDFRVRIKYANDMLNSQISEADQAFSGECGVFYHMTKQAVLQGTRFGHIKLAAEQHLPGDLTSLILNTAKERLAAEAPTLDLSDVEEKLGSVNQNNELMKQLTKINDTVDTYYELSEKQASLWRAGGEVMKTVGTGFRGLKKALISTSRPTKMFLLGGGIVGGVGVPASYSIGKQTGHLENSALKNPPKNYRK